MITCPPEHQLDQLLEGTLPAEASATVCEHLRLCKVCQSSLDSRSESPWLRAWAPAARRDALNQSQVPALVALMQDLLANQPHTLPQHPSDAPSRSTLPFLAQASVPGELGLLDDYRIQAEIGRGGMGIVLRAWDEKLQRQVALKIVRPELDDARNRQRLVREAQAAARFRHDHAVTVYAVVDAPDAPPYLVMELLSGPNLAAVLQERRPLQAAEAVEFLVGIADALALAHKAGLIHRDIKPTNILLDAATGRAKLTDFGLAQLEDNVRLTRESTVAGTPAYMSPEQAQGSKKIDGRSDIYSLGVTLYELLTGEVPYHGAVHLVLQQVIQEEPRAPRLLNDEVPRDLETICLKAIAKEPARRYQTADLLAADLRRWQRGEAILARPAGKVEKAQRWCRRNPRLAVLTASVFALLLALGVGASVVAFRLDRDRNIIASERNDAVAARVKADASAQAARDHFEVALGSLNTLLAEVKRLEPSPGLLPLKQKLTEAALGGLERISQSAERTPVGDQSVLTAHERLSNLYFLLGKTAESKAQLELLIARAEEQIAQDPNSVPALRGFATGHEGLGDLDRYNYRYPVAAEHYQAAQTVRKRLQEIHPQDVTIARDFSVSLGKLADIEAEKGDWKTAREKHREQLAATYAVKQMGLDSVQALRDLRFVESRLGQDCVGLAEYNEARQHYGRALANARALEEAGAMDAPYQISLALEWLGIIALRLADTAEAIPQFEQCLNIRRQIAANAPGNAEAKRNVAATLYNLGDCQFQTMALDKARRRYQEALAIHEPLARQDPALLKRQMDVSMTLGQLAAVEVCAEHYSEAAAREEKMLALWRDLERNPTASQLTPGVMVRTLETNTRILQSAAKSGLASSGPGSNPEKDIQGGLLALRSIHLARRGHHEEAIRLAEQAVSLNKAPVSLYSAARCYALSAGALESGNGQPATPTEQQARRRQYVDQAIQYLQEYIKIADPNLTLINAHPDWSAIRNDARFGKVLWGSR
jgi:tetratricopeptide (TPR) repeat protein